MRWQQAASSEALTLVAGVAHARVRSRPRRDSARVARAHSGKRNRRQRAAAPDRHVGQGAGLSDERSAPRSQCAGRRSDGRGLGARRSDRWRWRARLRLRTRSTRPSVTRHAIPARARMREAIGSSATCEMYFDICAGPRRPPASDWPGYLIDGQVSDRPDLGRLLRRPQLPVGGTSDPGRTRPPACRSSLGGAGRPTRALGLHAGRPAGDRLLATRPARGGPHAACTSPGRHRAGHRPGRRWPMLVSGRWQMSAADGDESARLRVPGSFCKPGDEPEADAFCGRRLAERIRLHAAGRRPGQAALLLTELEAVFERSVGLRRARAIAATGARAGADLR